jgi:hypothetical protein
MSSFGAIPLFLRNSRRIASNRLWLLPIFRIMRVSRLPLSDTGLTSFFAVASLPIRRAPFGGRFRAHLGGLSGKVSLFLFLFVRSGGSGSWRGSSPWRGSGPGCGDSARTCSGNGTWSAFGGNGGYHGGDYNLFLDELDDRNDELGAAENLHLIDGGDLANVDRVVCLKTGHIDVDLLG